MTQLPPTDPTESQSPTLRSAGGPQGPAPYSMSAVAGFVLSLFGCLGITALLGFIFAIVGLRNTRGGVRRGAGLAIAAIPISIIMGVISVGGLMLMLQGVKTLQVAMGLPKIYNVDGAVSPASLESLRGALSESFNAEVSAEKLTQWFESIRAEHGVLVELTMVGRPASIPNTDRVSYGMTGKFVSGTQNVEVIMKSESFSFRIDDIVIADSSPRPSH